jgi:hypothetical protein
MPRSGLAGANRFQDYLKTLGAGAGRSSTTDRSGVGMPYYRSTVDPAYEQTYQRVYRPNEKADRAYERRQELVTDQYLAYFAERDPKQRAALLQQYRQARRSTAGVLETRRGTPARLLEAASRSGADLGLSTTAERDRERPALRTPPPPRGPGATARPGTAFGRRGDYLDSGRGTLSDSDEGLPPRLTPSGRPRVGDRLRRTPSDVLNRARALDDRNELLPGSLSPAPSRRRLDRRPLTTPPPPPVNPE